MTFSAVSIVGTGPLAASVAMLIAETKTPVRLISAHTRNTDSEGAELAELQERFARRVRAHRPELADDILARVQFAPKLERSEGSDLVLEITQDATKTRRATLATIENHLSPGAVLAVHASAQEMKLMSEALRRKDQFVGVLFRATTEDEAPQLVELSLLADTAPGVAGACRAFCSWLSIGAVVAHDSKPAVAYREVRI